MKNDITKNEQTEFVPSWLDKNFPSDDEYMAVKDVVRFYLINTPCTQSSSRGIDISKWGKGNSILTNKLKKEIGLEDGKNYACGETYAEMKALFKKYSLEKDFTNIHEDMVVFSKTGTVFNSIFKHIRNAIAHSRWQVKDDIYYFEDVHVGNQDGKQYYSVSARIVLHKDSLIKWRDMIIAGPNEEDSRKIHSIQRLEDLLEKLKKSFPNNNFQRKDVIKCLGIDNNTWKMLYKYGKKEKQMHFKKPYWRMAQENVNEKPKAS